MLLSNRHFFYTYIYIYFLACVVFGARPAASFRLRLRFARRLLRLLATGKSSLMFHAHVRHALRGSGHGCTAKSFPPAAHDPPFYFATWIFTFAGSFVNGGWENSGLDVAGYALSGVRSAKESEIAPQSSR